MKLSFTTLGCPDWPLDRIIANAAEYGFDAIDFRGLTNEMNIYRLPEFSERMRETSSKIADAGLHVSCFSSSVRLFASENLEASLQEIRAYARLCEFFDVRYIRVFGGGIAKTDRSEAVQHVIRNATEMGKIVKAHGVKLLLETHDDWTACDHVRDVMEQIDREAIGVLWDVHHPYRMLGEQPAETWDRLGPWIEYTHVKDSRMKADGSGGFQYCLTGDGDIPLRDIYQLLQREGYKGYYTLEWEKKWHPEIEPPETAFPHYVQVMRELSSQDKR